MKAEQQIQLLLGQLLFQNAALTEENQKLILQLAEVTAERDKLREPTKTS